MHPKPFTYLPSNYLLFPASDPSSYLLPLVNPPPSPFRLLHRSHFYPSSSQFRIFYKPLPTFILTFSFSQLINALLPIYYPNPSPNAPLPITLFIYLTHAHTQFRILFPAFSNTQPYPFLIPVRAPPFPSLPLRPLSPPSFPRLPRSTPDTAATN